jgi:iron complex transport system permease protein
LKTESRTPATAGTGRVALLLGGVALVAALAVVSVCVGARSVPPGEIWRAFTDHTGTDQQTIVRDVRVPRTFLAVCVGAALGVSGALVQTLTRNPLAEPGIMGLTSGAGFAIIVGTVLGTGDSQFSRLLLAAAGAVLAAAVVYGVGRTFPLRLILAGVALTFVLSGLSLGMRLVDPTALDRLRVWT